MPSQDWYRPGKNYLRRDSAKFRYTKRNAKVVPPFGCSQKLGYCDSDSDNKPDKILKQYRSPALKKGYGCHPFDGPLFLGSFLRIPKIGPSVLDVGKSEPKSGPSGFFLNVIRPASTTSSFEAEVLAPVFTNNLFIFARVLPPKIGISAISAEVLIPESGPQDASTKVVVPRSKASGLSVTVTPPAPGVSTVSTELLPPNLSNPLEVSAKVVVPRSIANDLSVEVIPPASGVSTVSTEVLPPELSDSLDLSAEVVVPESGTGDVSVEVIIPASGVSSVSAEVLVPTLSDLLDVSAEVLVPESGTSDVSAEVIIPTPAVSVVSAKVLPPELSDLLDVSAEVLVPESGTGDVSAEVIIPASGVSTVSAEVLPPDFSDLLDVSAEVAVPRAAAIELSANTVVPASGVSTVSAEVLPPALGPSSLNLLVVLPPTLSISSLVSEVKVPELSSSLNLSATVLVSSSPITGVSAQVISPAEGPADLTAFVVPFPSAGSNVSSLEAMVKVPELSSSLDLSAAVLVSNSPITGLTAQVPAPGVAAKTSNLEATVKVPELSSPLNLSASVLVSSSPVTDLSVEVASPVEGPADLEAEVIPWPSAGSNVSNLESVVKAPELSSSLDVTASVLVSSSSITDVSAEVAPPVVGSTDLTSALIPWPSAGSNVSSLDSSVKVPELSSPLNLSASVLLTSSTITSLSAEVTPPIAKPSVLTAFVNTPTFGPSDLFIDYTNQNLVLSAPTQTASFNQTIAVSRGGIFIVPFNVGSSASTFKFHLNAFGSPDRFQILYDTSGISDLLGDCDVVADSLYVGDNLSSTNPADGKKSLPVYVYVGTGGDSFASTFNDVGSETVTITSSKRAPLTGFRTSSNPNGVGQIGVQNEVYISSTETSQGLPYSDGNICLTISKPSSTNTIVYLKIYAASNASGSSVVKIENI